METLIIVKSTESNVSLGIKIAEALGLCPQELQRNFNKALYGSSDRYSRWNGPEWESNGDFPFSVPGTISDYNVIDLRPFEIAKSIKLNDQYSAVVDGAEVVVGCQRFPASKVLELAKLIKGK